MLAFRNAGDHDYVQFIQASELQMLPTFHIRLATAADAGLIARHRARMFQDMGQVPPHLFDEFLTACEQRLSAMFETNEYVGWLASSADQPNDVIAGAGVQLRMVPPHPLGNPESGFRMAEGRQAIIINVFTEPEWRRRGAAKLLLEEIIAWARVERLDSLVLHASEEGRALYEQLDFKASREMRLDWRRLASPNE
ncbi:MAG: GNAT family N-acetyltransferase [Chthoniobacterales bacterium]|nr:GNAT family N-acetyltransferase [Chthoniobacterales bacterium]